MSRDELLKKLQDLQEVAAVDCERAHKEADDALLEYVNDAEISAAFELIEKWYA
ncbi:MAG: hypothetical protein PHU85_00390 [Phycisphaerae bacterium]|nr:hypothetical protein [Phycisphaerae bacterium]